MESDVNGVLIAAITVPAIYCADLCLCCCQCYYLVQIVPTEKTRYIHSLYIYRLTSGFRDGTRYIIPKAVFDATRGRSPKAALKRAEGISSTSDEARR